MNLDSKVFYPEYQYDEDESFSQTTNRSSKFNLNFSKADKELKKLPGSKHNEELKKHFKSKINSRNDNYEKFVSYKRVFLVIVFFNRYAE